MIPISKVVVQVDHGSTALFNDLYGTHPADPRWADDEDAGYLIVHGETIVHEDWVVVHGHNGRTTKIARNRVVLIMTDPQTDDGGES